MENKSKSRGWLIGKLGNQSQLEKSDEQESISAIATELVQTFPEEIEPTDTTNTKNLFSKENQDKVSLDIIVSLENMLKDRQLILYKNKDLEEQLYSLNEIISRLKHEQMKKDQLLQEKSKELSVIEGKLTKKQMSYDQLLEDYKDYQNTSNLEYEKVSNLLEIENNKYNRLYEESTAIQHQHIQKINQLEERIRELEVENQNYLEQYRKIQEEKNQLMKSINDFTERMSFSFSHSTDSSSQTE
ncbi:hypothetical protein [Bacillus sp. FJAT-49736]|uniref:hypothetical protein n=1 Tax=Bacillus sp. FJAT-49736 TaxID=2833582 RepID=UPI0020163302|nr:hypothetical protein [Bacillus sp. FJAT-49736]